MAIFQEKITRYFYLLILAVQASCTLLPDGQCHEAFFCDLRQRLADSTLLTDSASIYIDELANNDVALQAWEQQELTQHIEASILPRYSHAEQMTNVETVLRYKLVQRRYYFMRQDSIQRISLSVIYNSLSNGCNIDSSFVEDSYWGTSSYMVVLLPQIHEVNNTADEQSIVEPVQKNIIDIQNCLYSLGARTFLYEGIPFKEISRSLPTKMPLDSIAKYFSKKAEVDFETKHPQVLSYGIETKSVHHRADSIRSYYWALETYYNRYAKGFPYEYKLFHQTMQSHIDSCLMVNDANLRMLKINYFDSLVKVKFPEATLVTAAKYKEVKDSVFHEMLEVMLNERNRTFVDNIEHLQSFTGERFLVLKAGTSHFDEVDLLKDYNGFDLKTVQEILRERHISYVYLVPYYVWHYNL